MAEANTLTITNIQLYIETQGLLNAYNRIGEWRQTFRTRLLEGKRNYNGRPLRSYVWLFAQINPIYNEDWLGMVAPERFLEILEQFYNNPRDRQHLDDQVEKLKKGEIDHPDFIDKKDHEEITKADSIPDPEKKEQSIDNFVQEKAQTHQPPTPSSQVPPQEQQQLPPEQPPAPLPTDQPFMPPPAAAPTTSSPRAEPRVVGEVKTPPTQSSTPLSPNEQANKDLGTYSATQEKPVFGERPGQMDLGTHPQEITPPQATSIPHPIEPIIHPPSQSPLQPPPRQPGWGAPATTKAERQASVFRESSGFGAATQKAFRQGISKPQIPVSAETGVKRLISGGCMIGSIG